MARILKITDLVVVEPAFAPPLITAIPEGRTDVTLNGIEIVLEGQAFLPHQKPIPDSPPLVHVPFALKSPSLRRLNITINGRHVMTDEDLLTGSPGCINYDLTGKVTPTPPVDVFIG